MWYSILYRMSRWRVDGFFDLNILKQKVVAEVVSLDMTAKCIEKNVKMLHITTVVYSTHAGNKRRRPTTSLWGRQ